MEEITSEISAAAGSRREGSATDKRPAGDV
jgi:hypothetical protein